MKTDKLIEPVLAVVDKLAACDFVAQRVAAHHRADMRKRSMAWVGAGLGVALAAHLTYRAYCTMEEKRSELARRRADDEKLDWALLDTMDASDAISQY